MTWFAAWKCAFCKQYWRWTGWLWLGLCNSQKLQFAGNFVKTWDSSFLVENPRNFINFIKFRHFVVDPSLEFRFKFYTFSAKLRKKNQFSIRWLQTYLRMANHMIESTVILDWIAVMCAADDDEGFSRLRSHASEKCCRRKLLFYWNLIVLFFYLLFQLSRFLLTPHMGAGRARLFHSSLALSRFSRRFVAVAVDTKLFKWYKYLVWEHILCVCMMHDI